MGNVLYLRFGVFDNHIWTFEYGLYRDYTVGVCITELTSGSEGLGRKYFSRHHGSLVYVRPRERSSYLLRMLL